MNINFSQQAPINSQMVFPQNQYGPYYPSYNNQITQNSQFVPIGEYSDYNFQVLNSDIYSNSTALTFKNGIENNLEKIQNKFSNSLLEKLKLSFNKNEKLFNECKCAIKNQTVISEMKGKTIINNIDYIIEGLNKLSNRILVFGEEKTEIINKNSSYLHTKEEQHKLIKDRDRNREAQIENEFYDLKAKIEDNIKFVQIEVSKILKQEEETTLELNDKIIERFGEIKNGLTCLNFPGKNSLADEDKSNISLSVKKLADIKVHVERLKTKMNNYCISKENISLIGFKTEVLSQHDNEEKSNIIKVSDILQKRNFMFNTKKKKLDITFYNK